MTVSRSSARRVSPRPRRAGPRTTRSASSRAARTASSRSRRARRRSSSAVRSASAARSSAARAPVERLARLALGRLDRRQGRLERALRLGQPRPGVGRRSPSGRPSRSAIANAWLPPGRPIVSRYVGLQRLEVELDRGVAGARRRVGVGLELGVVGRRGDERPGPDEVVEQRLGERRALGRVGAGAELVEQDERARARPRPRSG